MDKIHTPTGLNNTKPHTTPCKTSQVPMDTITFFDGITFNRFGLNSISTVQAHHYPEFYGLQYIHAGYLNLTVNHGPCHRLHGPVAFITDPHHFYDYFSPKGMERQHYYVCFTGARVERYRAGGLLQFDPDRPFFSIQDQRAFLQGMLNLLLSIQNEENHEYSVALLDQMLLSVHQQQTTHPPASLYLKVLESLAQKIMLNPERTWDFKQEAKTLNISEKHFQLLFRKTQGMPPHHFVLRQRLCKAMELLIQEQAPIKTIAAACGFPNELYFSRLFKKYFHQPPSDYRKNL